MIYLSGAMQAERIGERKDIGVIVSFRPNGDFMGKTKRFTKCLWAADNGCFTNPNLKVADYLNWLKELSEVKEEMEDETIHSMIENCLFATAPDVVGDAKETWKRSKDVLPLIRELGYPAALVAQDGIEDEEIHWDDFDCLFIGGSTEWKLNSYWLCREAITRGKWVHMGRVNSLRRMLIARFSGCHSADGTTLAFAPDKKFEEVSAWLEVINRQPVLNF